MPGLNLKNVKTNASSGSVNQKPSKRGKSEANDEYAKARIEELKQRCELYSLRVARLRSNLLDANEVRSEYIAVTDAIKSVIAKGPLSRTEKSDVLAQRVPVDQFLESVTRRQTTDTGRKDASPAASEGIDFES